MKRFLPFLSLAIVMTACNSNADKIAATHPSVAAPQAPGVNPDTVGFAAFQNYKAQNELVVEEPKQIIQYAVAKPIKKASTPVKKVAKSFAKAPKPSLSIKPSESTVSENAGAGSGAVNSESDGIVKAPVNKGWSKSAKGAVIGGASGAIAGAILNKKNRAVGAVLGGVLGAGGGYVIGRGMDKKDGRIE